MTASTAPGCAENFDPLKLIREGTDRVSRARTAPDPATVPVDERDPEHAMVFAAAYADFLRFHEQTGGSSTSWQGFFASDVSAQLALIAIEDVGGYRATLTALLRALTDPAPSTPRRRLKNTLATVFDCLGTLAFRLDALSHELPVDQPLREVLRNLIRTRLAPMLRRLTGYYRAGRELPMIPAGGGADARIRILGGPLIRSSRLLADNATLPAMTWPGAFGETAQPPFDVAERTAFTEAYGPGTSTRERVNHLASHNLFRAVTETFLAALSRVVGEARAALRATLEGPGHQPHYALFLAFLRLLEHARSETNTLSARHLDFYYRRVLRLERRPAAPGRAHVLVELAKHVDTHQLEAGTLLKAGKDNDGHDASAVVDRDLVANRARIAKVRSLYRQPVSDSPTAYDGRIFAGDIATDTPWHPFVEKLFADGEPRSIETPPGEVGFAIASHYLWLAEGARTITVILPIAAGSAEFRSGLVRCRLTSAKGWLDREVSLGAPGGPITFTIELTGADPAITPYVPKVHGYRFDTALPIMLITLSLDASSDRGRNARYADLAGVRIGGVTLRIDVTGLRTLALSNDNGPVDASKPFLAFGATPIAGSSLVIGSKEVFQKKPTSVKLLVTWADTPRAHGTTPTVAADQLLAGTWRSVGPAMSLAEAGNELAAGVEPIPVDVPDLTPDVPYTTASRSGYLRLRLSGGFGTATYPLDLATWIAGKSTPAAAGAPKGGSTGAVSTTSAAGSGTGSIVKSLAEANIAEFTGTGTPQLKANIAVGVDGPPQPPVLPMVSRLTLDYTAKQEIGLATPSEPSGRFFHVTPFGHAQPSPTGKPASLPLLPPFLAGNDPSEGELYLGVADLMPPQNLALLFQVVDGTANPRAAKPENHLRWSYLRGNDWVSFPADAVGDGTDGLLASGIVTLAVPREADRDHTLLPAGLHWIRIAVPTGTDAVCRLVAITAQALTVTDRAAGHRSAVPSLPPGTVTKLDTPVVQVKGVSQPYPSFGGRPVESDAAFAGRVSERLRHRDRAITLWDYEHLVLEAFPAIYQVRCLNHTEYEPGDGGGRYRELAPGHVTVVTIPDLSAPNPFDPLRPYTSLRVLGEIHRFLARRMSCFTTLHVRNPTFEEVRVALRVRFREGVDETHAINRLRGEITEFLSPWAFRGDARPSFNGTIHKSVLVDFVDDRGYVDYVTDVQLFRPAPGVAGLGPDLEQVTGSRAVSILVSAPPAHHSITAVRGVESPSGERCDPSSGVMRP